MRKVPGHTYVKQGERDDAPIMLCEHCGVVEDVRALREERDALKIQVESLLANAAATKAVAR